MIAPVACGTEVVCTRCGEPVRAVPRFSGPCSVVYVIDVDEHGVCSSCLWDSHE
jgi:hypothetical protein